ncbi:uncharacterized protein LOC121416653 isoform X2 [Lytechinus variegatus]|uniref:uncharacterized protein LOC121416653 isoform X2 n=1 Tax=Lytechinus variegatus TaxID=7654 RepID=UPI001BB0EAA9|nr:uncharacterized protein LOC121416653 isoform X2 [Lytechinus variegatus]
MGNHSNATCQEPNGHELASMLASAMAEDPTVVESTRALFQTPLGTSSAETILRNYEFNLTTHLHDVSECPRYFLNALDYAIESRSLCPWRYVLQSDTERYPRDILVVQCECKECVIPELGTFSSYKARCHPVIKGQQVLRRTGQCIDGVERYERQFEPIPVACVCEKSRIFLGTHNVYTS